MTKFREDTMSVGRVVILEDDAIATMVWDIEDKDFDKYHLEYDWNNFQVNVSNYALY